MVGARKGNLTPLPRQMVLKQHLDRVQVRRARLASDSIAGVVLGIVGVYSHSQFLISLLESSHTQPTAV